MNPIGKLRRRLAELVDLASLAMLVADWVWLPLVVVVVFQTTE